MRSALVTKAKWQNDWEGTWICFCVPAETAANMVQDLAEGKEHQLTLKRGGRKRSLDANAYFWMLLGALSAKVGIPSKTLYREYIKDVGDNYAIVPVKAAMVGNFCEWWCDGHDGRIAEDMGPCRNTEGYNNVRLYIGSSDYDTVQMSRLIDLVVTDCKEFRIDTLTPQERDRLLKEWENGSQRIQR